MLNQITAVTREEKVCVDLTADDDADAEEDRNTSSSNNALSRTMLDPAMQMKIYIDPTSIRRATLLSAPTPTPLSTRDTQGVQTARGNDTQAVLTEAKDTHRVIAEAHQPSCTHKHTNPRNASDAKEIVGTLTYRHMRLWPSPVRASKNAKNVFQKKLNTQECKRTHQT